MIRNTFAAALCFVAAASITQADTLFNNGDPAATGSCATPSLVPGIRTGVGNGVSGANTSLLTAAQNSFGSSSQFNAGTGAANGNGSGFAVGDDFTVPCGQTWSVTNLRTYFYRTGLTLSNIGISSVRYAIWNGKPGTPGAAVIFGGLTTNQLANTVLSNSGINRVNAIPGDGNRPVIEANITLTGVSLTAGTYWVTYAFGTNAGTAGVFTPPNTPSRATDNGVQGVNVNTLGTGTLQWNNAVAGTTGNPPFGYPFILEGTATGTICAPTTEPEITLVADVWSTGSAAITAGQVKFFPIIVTAVDAANNTALDIDTVGSVDGSSVPLNTTMALYCADGNLVANGVSNDNGPGTLSLLSFGKGTRPASSVAGIGAGDTYNGQNGATLSAGLYYVAVSSSGNTSFTNGFTNTVTGGTDGTVTVRVREVTNQGAVTSPDGGFTDAGQLQDISLGGTATVVNTTINSGEMKWIKFEIPNTFPTVTTSTAHLAIDTEGSSLTPANSTALALFKADGSRAANPGAPSGRVGGTDNLSTLSFGKFNGSMARPSNATTVGYLFNGRSLPAAGEPIAPGVYYVAVIPGQTSGAFGQANFDATPRNAPNSGSLTVRLSYYSDPGAAQPPAVAETLTLVDGTRVSSSTVPFTKKGEVIWFKFNLPENLLPAGADNAALDIDLEGSFASYTTGQPNRAGVVIYFPDGTRTNANPTTFDDFSSTGVFGGLSFGSTGSRSYALGQARFNGFSMGTGVMIPGDYYVGVTRFDGVGAANYGLTNWDVNTTYDSNAGAVAKINVSFYSATTNATPKVIAPLVDQDLGTINASGSPYTLNQTPAFDIAARDIRWFKFTTDAALTNAGDKWLDIDTAGWTGIQGVLALFDNNGVLISSSRAADAATPAITQPGLYFGSTSPTGRATTAGTPQAFATSVELPAGTYWLAFTRWNNAAPATFAVGPDSWNILANHNFVNFASIVQIRTNLTAPTPAGCNPADIACDDGVPLAQAPGCTNSNLGPNEGDFNAFFAAEGFFFQAGQGTAAIGSFCDIACDDGEPLAANPGCTNNGVNEGDYNCFFNNLFLLCTP